MDKLNILLVDDQPSKLLAYETILSALGENLIKASSGTEALDRLLKNHIAIVLLDVNMPDLDGFQLADMIREHPRYQDVAIIFVTSARMTDSDRLSGYAHGAVDYLSVPIVPELLRAKVRVFAELHRKRQELELLYGEMSRLSTRMIAVQDQERRRIARELHDSLGQHLTLAKLVADGIKSPDLWVRGAEVSALIDDAIQQTRSISHLLHPPLLDEIGLESAVRWYLDGLSKRSGFKTGLEVEPAEFLRLPPHLENAVYRIIQEAVTNSFRHSGGSEMCVVLRQDHAMLSLAVRDDGKGFPEEVTAFRAIGAGIGIGGMRQRVLELGGKLRLTSGNPGALVEVVIPLRCDQNHSQAESTQGSKNPFPNFGTLSGETI